MGVASMMNVDAVAGRPPLVLLVDPVVASRHRLWRALHGTFGVLEAESVESARTWIARRPDIDAIIVHDDLPDGNGLELLRELAASRHPLAGRAIVLVAPQAASSASADAGPTLVEVGDLLAVAKKLATWLPVREARKLLLEAEQLFA
jgi:CheY-like chemotaxis protein